MLSVGQAFLGVTPDARLKIHCADALPWMAQQPDESFDVIIVDVAVAAVRADGRWQSLSICNL
jgi:spermidine synthase